MPPQFTALPLGVNSSFGVVSSAPSRTSRENSGKGGAWVARPWHVTSPLRGPRKRQKERMANYGLCVRPAQTPAHALFREAGATLALPPPGGHPSL
ncbi:MAG TPA: hypothetical protein VNW73_17580 [Ktedonobacteraceae bacterium]|nr:hypothetical protein [Ktedonobacteraceae bacterium]